MNAVTKVFSKRIDRLRYFYFAQMGVNEVTIDGLKFKLDRDLFGEKIFKMLCTGKYERHESEIVRTTIEHDDRVLDLGGGIGVLALTAAKRVKAGAVTTVEANPILVPLIKENAVRNGLLLNVIHGAVSDKTGTETLYLANDYWRSTALDSGLSNKIEVPTVNFLELVERTHPTYLVADIEGLEVRLLKMLSKAHIKKICVEIHPKLTGMQAIADMVATLRENGFVVDEARSSKQVLYLC